MSQLTAILLLSAAIVFVNSEEPKKHLSFQLEDGDIISKDEAQLKHKFSEDEGGFIGDLVIGKRHADETVYRRTMQIMNYDPFVSFYAVDFSVKSGAIHFLSIRNNHKSYAVACDGPYTLGTSITRFVVRVPPRTEAFLSVELATHPE